MSALSTPETVIEFPAVPDPKSFPFPVWSGLLMKKHYGRIKNSLWMFLWLLDRTTAEENGWGVVLGGKPVKDEEIADCFGFHKNKMAIHRERLLGGGYIQATRTPYGFTYQVRNSRKFIWRQKRVTETGESEGKRVTDSRDSLGGRVTETGESRVTETGESRVTETGGNKEDLAVRPSSKTKPTPCANPKTGLHESPVPLPELETVKRVFGYYLQKLGKNPKLYEFTRLRKQKGMARLGEALFKTDDDLAKAEELMRIAVDNLAASGFHRGDNDRKKAYDSWEKHLFPSQEKFEWWLEQ